MTLIYRAFQLTLAALAFAAPALAQSPVPFQLSPDQSPRFEVAVQGGWLGVMAAARLTNGSRRYDTGTVEASAAYFLTRHVRAGVAIGRSAGGRLFASEPIATPDAPYQQWRYTEHIFRGTTIAPSIGYQFLDNRWVHPFVNAGVHLIHETHQQTTPFQSIPQRSPLPPILLPATERTESSFRAIPFAGAGLNFYVHERSFIRTELQVARGAGDPLRAAWTFGVGFNF